jgi:hypothetical protein
MLRSLRKTRPNLSIHSAKEEAEEEGGGGGRGGGGVGGECYWL